MFSWTCPKCGREVPPAYTDCPNCTAQARTPQPPANATPPPIAPRQEEVPPAKHHAPGPFASPPPPPQPQAPPAPVAPLSATGAFATSYPQPVQTPAPPPPQTASTGYVPQQPQYAQTGPFSSPPQSYQQPQYPPPPQQHTYAPPQPPPQAAPQGFSSERVKSYENSHSSLFASAPPAQAEVPQEQPVPTQPASVMTQVLAVLLTVAVIGMLFFATQFFRSRGSQAAAKATPDVSGTAVPTAAVASNKSHPLAKYVEVTGVRLTDEKRKRYCRLLVVNHSSADLPDLHMNVRVVAADKEIVDFPVTVPSLGPYESRDVVTEVKVGLKPYEMPDWQMTRASFEITSER